MPVVRLTHLDEAQKRTLRIAVNRLAEQSGWNQELLALELKELLELDLTLELDFDFTITGFASPEIDQLIEGQVQASMLIRMTFCLTLLDLLCLSAWRSLAFRRALSDLRRCPR